MTYEMEELLPIIAKLVEKYTGHESTSITYEKAEQFMEAVLYCIGEMSVSEGNSMIQIEKMSAQQAYEIGYKSVVRKVKSALDIYNDVLKGFTGYGNHCLYDTVVKGIPEFFKWYNVEFEPQNTILTLDYPVLKDLSPYSGIDKVYEFITCIRTEKIFLSRFSEDYVIDILRNYHCQYQDMVENICEIVYMDIIYHVLAGKSLAEQSFSESNYKQIQKVLFQFDREHIKNRLIEITKALVEKYYEDNNDLLKYLTASVDDIVVRLKMAVNSGRMKDV